MITEAQYAAATALFSAMTSREAGVRSRDALFDLYQQCLDAVTGKRVPPSIIDVTTECPHCGGRVEIGIPRG